MYDGYTMRKHHQKHLPMGVSNSRDNFQQKVHDLLKEFELICVYIDKLLIIIIKDWIY